MKIKNLYKEDLNKNINIEEFNESMADELKKISKEPVICDLKDRSDLFVYGNELACLRIAYKYRKYNDINLAYSSNLKTWYLAIYNFR